MDPVPDDEDAAAGDDGLEDIAPYDPVERVGTPRAALIPAIISG